MFLASNIKLVLFSLLFLAKKGRILNGLVKKKPFNCTVFTNSQYTKLYS